MHGMADTTEQSWEPKAGREERHYMIVKVWRSTDMQNNVEVTPLAVW